VSTAGTGTDAGAGAEAGAPEAGAFVSILITSNGHVLIGAVAPSVLYSAAAQLR